MLCGPRLAWPSDCHLRTNPWAKQCNYCGSFTKTLMCDLCDDVTDVDDILNKLLITCNTFVKIPYTEVLIKHTKRETYY